MRQMSLRALRAAIWPHEAQLSVSQHCERHIPTLRKNRVARINKSAYICNEQPLAALDTKMKITQELLRQIVSDLGLDVPFVKG